MCVAPPLTYPLPTPIPPPYLSSLHLFLHLLYTEASVHSFWFDYTTSFFISPHPTISFLSSCYLLPHLLLPSSSHLILPRLSNSFCDIMGNFFFSHNLRDRGAFTIGITSSHNTRSKIFWSIDTPLHFVLISSSSYRPLITTPHLIFTFVHPHFQLIWD